MLLTCSTLGDAVAQVVEAACPVLRADAALAGALAPGAAVALCAAPATLAPTRALVRRWAPEAEVRLVPGAWVLFRAGSLDDYHRHIAAGADLAFRRGAVRVALMQTSMTPAASLCRAGTPLTAPPLALRAALAAAAAR